MHAVKASLYNILIFTSLNFIPLFFDLVGLSVWIATFLLCWELHQRGEWETLRLISISPKEIVRSLFFMGIIFSLISLLGKEFIAHPLSQITEKYKITHFKQKSPRKIFNKWILLTQKSFLHIEYLDLKEQKGTGLSIIYMSNNFKPNKKIELDDFNINYKSKTVHAESATIIDFDTNQFDTNQFETNNTELSSNFELKLPMFFLNLKTLFGSLSLKDQIINTISASRLSNKNVFNIEVGKLLNRLLSHLQPLIYVMLTLCIFFIFSGKNRWIAMILPYPVFVVLISFSNYLVQHNTSAITIIIPYLLLLLLVYNFMRRLISW